MQSVEFLYTNSCCNDLSPNNIDFFSFLLVNTTSKCRVGDKPVCSTEGKTFPSSCHMAQAKATLAYTGRCIDSCRKSRVCGINGISYKSECEAWSGKFNFYFISN